MPAKAEPTPKAKAKGRPKAKAKTGEGKPIKPTTLLGTLVRGANLLQLSSNWTKMSNALDVFIEQKMVVRNIAEQPVSEEEHRIFMFNLRRNITLLEDQSSRTGWEVRFAVGIVLE